jgi:YVTN family beta-propeller protein
MQNPDRIFSKMAPQVPLIPTWLLRSLLVSLVMWSLEPIPAAGQSVNGSAAHPAIVYVSNGGGGITEINTANNSVIATAPFPNNANGVVLTPDGRRMYASNRDVGQVTLFDAKTNVPLVVIPAGNGNDNLGLAMSPDGEVVYVANQISGTITAIRTDTNKVVQVIPTGIEPIWITFSDNGSRAYVSNQVSGTVSVVATASGTVINNIGGFSCPFQSAVTRDGSKLLVSSQCDGTVKVVNLATNMIVNSIFAGAIPRGIALSPDGTRAYVANFGGNTVQVIDVAAQTNLNAPITVGANPWGAALAPGGKLYVANFGNNTISVIDTSTNTVTATLPSRGNPEDVTVSITARPRVLDYSFQAFDAPGSVDTTATGNNNHRQIVGSFQDSLGIRHGYLRRADGSFVTIDPPGSIFTVAVGINDAGTIVGEWQASTGAFHGFSRSASGVYKTVDFPGAADSVLIGINEAGDTVGAYDLGDQTTAIGFELRSGVFTSFEDPAAVPMQTQPNDINSQSLIIGLYGDAAGNLHGFTRHPSGQFQNFDFPGADNTFAWKINDVGQVAGQYSTNFPGHAFVLTDAADVDGPASPSHYFSLDYPDSQATAGRGINNQGQIVGQYRLRGSPARHGFLATPNED